MVCHTTLLKKGREVLQIGEIANPKALYECFAFWAILGTVLLWIPWKIEQEKNLCYIMSLNTITG